MMKYPVAAPDLSGNELAYVQECIHSTWISSSGRFLNEFESRFAEFTRSHYGVATCNGTAALHLALEALGVGPGDEVIVPALTFVATANAVSYCGAAAVFADCDPDTWCISVKSIERLITPRTKGIIPVHLYGHPCDMGPLMELAWSQGLWVLEDCAEAIGATYEGRPVGTFGHAGVFSFFGNKILTTGEGGMVISSDERLAHRLRQLRGQGMDPGRRYWHPVIGYNYRMTNVAAAIGLAQLERAEELIAARQRLAGWYHEHLGGVPHLTLPVNRPPAANVFWMYSLLLPSAALRDPVMAQLAVEGIETRPFFYPVHEFTPYRNHRTDDGCPTAMDLSYRGISLPTSPYLKEADVSVITSQLRELLPAHVPLTRSAA